MDRNDLIKALGTAFAESKDDPSKSTIVSATAGEKDVLRLLTNDDNSSEKNLFLNHPDAHMVQNLVMELSRSRQSDIEIVGRELIVKFNEAVSSNNESKITSIIATCKDCFAKLQSVRHNSPEQALVYMTVIDKIKHI